MIRPPPRSPLFPSPPLFRPRAQQAPDGAAGVQPERVTPAAAVHAHPVEHGLAGAPRPAARHQVDAMPPLDQPDRKSTRLNSSHSQISYAVFCLKKKKYNLRERMRFFHFVSLAAVQPGSLSCATVRLPLPTYPDIRPNICHPFLSPDL